MSNNIHTETFPQPWWCFNAHVHTVASTYLARKHTIDVERIEIDTPDDDFLELDITNTTNPKAIAVLFHGLEGSSERFYLINLAYTLHQQGITSVLVNFRGCGYKINRQPYYYNAGFTVDYETIFNWVKNRFNDLPMFAVGFSLGGNALIKYMGENGSNANVDRAVAVSPPYDLLEGAYNLQKGLNSFYDAHFAKSVNKKLELKRDAFPDLPVFKGKTLFDFDDQITAPVHGYIDAIHYYTENSSKVFMPEVQKPLLLIHSEADTICPLEYAPFDVINEKQNIESYFTSNGGHVGFWSTQKNWINQIIVDWLMNK